MKSISWFICSGASAHKPCIFPFKFNGVVYNQCTWVSAHLTEHKVRIWYHFRIYATKYFLFLTLQNSWEASSSLRDVLFYVFSTLTIYSHLPWQQSAPASNQPVAYIHKQIHSKGIIFLPFIAALVLHPGGRDWSPYWWQGQVGQLWTWLSHSSRWQRVNHCGAGHWR